MSKELIIFNKTKDSDYNKQRDNEMLPIETCGPTSMAMALFQAGYTDWVKKDEDPADTITKALMTDEAYERMYSILGAKETNWKPFNIHAVLTWGVNKMLKKQVSTFKTTWSINEVILNIIKGGGAVLSGDFTLPNGVELGHIVSLAGFATYQQNIEEAEKTEDINLSDIPYFIIDDPYGDYTKGYRDHHGMNIEFDYNLFYDTLRKKGDHRKRWAHLIQPNT